MEGSKALRDPRRILVAAGLMVLLGGAGIGVVGAATADAGDGLPATWSIAEWHQGDRASFKAGALTAGSLWTPETFLVEAAPLQGAREADGTLHPSIVLDFLRADRDNHDGGFVNWSSTYRISLVDGHTVSYDWESGQASASSQSGVITNGVSSEVLLRQYPDDLVVPCGFLPPFQGTPGLIAGGVRLAGCGDLAFHADRIERFADRPALVLVAPGTPFDTEVWYVQDLPLPVHVVRAGTTRDLDWWLDGFSTAGAAYPAEAVVASQPRPAVSLASTDRFGPDMSGLQPKYALVDAIQDVMDAPDEDGNALRAFTDDHPEWFLMAAEYGERVDGDAETFGWAVELTGGDERMTVLSYQYIDESPDNLVGSVLTGEDQQQRHYRHVFARQETDLEALPRAMPRVADAARVWADETGNGLADLRSWGFRHDCMSACDDPSFTVHAGDAQDVRYMVFGNGLDLSGQTAPSTSSSTVYVDMQGALEEMVLVNTERTGGLLVPSVEPAPAGQAAAIPPSEGWNVPPAAAAGIGMAAAAIGLLYYLWPVVKGLPGFALFSRLRSPELLEHPARQSIVDTVEAAPGIHFKELQRRTGLANGTLRHHTRHLVQAGLLQERASGGFTCYFAGGRVPQAVALAAPVLKSSGAKAVFRAILDRPGLSNQDLAVTVGLSSGTVGYHLKRLREAGLVDSRRSRRAVHLFPTDAGEQAAKAARAA